VERLSAYIRVGRMISAKDINVNRGRSSNHDFLPGHRLMVQMQSSWFPLYDRNPQTFVPNIFMAKPEDYRKE
jgi:predicted acyl esterase